LINILFSKKKNSVKKKHFPYNKIFYLECLGNAKKGNIDIIYIFLLYATLHFQKSQSYAFALCNNKESKKEINFLGFKGEKRFLHLRSSCS
jgi:hypothetical protein